MKGRTCVREGEGGSAVEDAESEAKDTRPES